MAAGDCTYTFGLTGTKTPGDAIESFSESFTVSSIAQEVNREIVLTVADGLTTILTLRTLGAAGLATLNGLLIWNDTATNFVTIGVILAATDAFYINLPAKRPFYLWSRQFDVTTGGAFGAFVNAVTVNALAD